MKELIEKLKKDREMYRNDICPVYLTTEEMNIIIQALSLKEASKDTSESDKDIQVLTSVKSESAEDKKQHAIGYAEFIGNNKSIYIKHKMVWVTKNPKLESIYTTNELYNEYLNTLNNK